MRNAASALPSRRRDALAPGFLVHPKEGAHEDARERPEQPRRSAAVRVRLQQDVHARVAARRLVRTQAGLFQDGASGRRGA